MNKNKISIGVTAFLCMTMLFSCKKETVKTTDGGTLYQPYVPLKVGKYITYAVDSFLWDDKLCVKFTHSYQMKYQVSDTFFDQQHRLTYTVDIFIRKGDTAQWRPDDVIYITPAAEKYEVVQKNIRFIRMMNPVKQNFQWPGNSLMPVEDHDYDYLHDWNYTYQNVLEPFDNGEKKFDNTLTVSETNQVVSNPEVAPDKYAQILASKSVYAYQVGMIYHEYTYWIYDPSLGLPACRKGNGVIMRAVDYN